jgi:CheY-like chemotaxis protein/MinD-like ATPase involved in chromosome partitioning or flagellar assembly
MTERKILLIEPDPPSLKYLADILRQEGYEVLVAPTGKEGLIAAWRDLPDIILVDPVLPDLSGEELAARLRAEPRTVKLPLVALSSDARPARRKSCLDAGFSEFLVKSPQLLPSLRETLARVVSLEETSEKQGGLLIAFLSAKGGTGTSSLCANLAMNIADRDHTARVVVADLVLPIGSIAGIVGYTGAQNVVTIAKMPAVKTTPEFLQDGLPQLNPWHFNILAGAPDPGRSNELDFGRVSQLIEALRFAFDVVVLDLGRSLSRISLPLIERADMLAMIVGADLTTADLSKTVWEYLKGNGVQSSAMYIIMNRPVGLAGLTREQAEKIIGLPIQASMPHLGENLSLANYQNRPYCMKFPGDTASIILSETARQIVEMARQRRSA